MLASESEMNEVGVSDARHAADLQRGCCEMCARGR